MPLRDPSSSLEDAGLQPRFIAIHKFPIKEDDAEEVDSKEDADTGEGGDPDHTSSPINEMPDDVLREIFVRTLPTSHNAVVSPNQPPLLLTRICSRWRAIALDTPAIWSSIHLPAPVLPFDASEEDGDKILDVITPGLERTAKEWLARSRDSPLNISLRINADDRHSAIHSETSTTLTNTFIHLSHRWKHLSIESVEDECTEKILQVAAADAPTLESLEIDSGFSMACSPDPKIYKKASLLNAPNLRLLSLHLAKEDVSDIPVNWAQLTSLAIRAATDVSLKSLAFLFRECTNLEQFSIRLAFEHEGPLPAAEPARINCPRLRELSVVDTDDDRIVLYTRLDLPNLRRLDYFRYPSKPCGMTSLLPATHGSVRHLITNPSGTSFNDLISWLKLCPNLETLSFVQGPFELYAGDSTALSSNLLDMLSRKSDNEDSTEDNAYLCPNLRRFECIAPSEFTAQKVLQFIKAKQAQADPRIAKLTDVIVVFEDLQEDAKEVEAELQPFRAEGLHVELVYKLRTQQFYARKLFVPVAGLQDNYKEGFDMGVFGGSLRL